MNDSLKSSVLQTCAGLLSAKINALEAALKELTEGAANEGKSSAGDKHETARAMAQLEQEKLGKQLNELQQQRAVLEKNNGQLLQTSRGILFVCIALGRIEVEGKTVMVLSPQSPLGALLSGKKEGAAVVFNGAEYRIEAVLA